MKIIIQKKEKIDDKFRVVVAVMDGETEVFGRVITARTDHEVDFQLKMLAESIKERDEEYAKLPAEGEWVPPVEPVEEVVPEVPPTPEEIAAKEAEEAAQALQSQIDMKMSELEALAEKERKLTEYRTLATVNSDIDKLVKEIDTLTASKIK